MYKKNNEKSFLDHIIDGQAWEGDDIWLYKPFYQNTEKHLITIDMIKKEKRRKKYFILSASIPFLDDNGDICCYAEYGGYKYLYKVPVEEVYHALPGYGEHLLHYWKRKGKGTYHKNVFMLAINQIYCRKIYEVRTLHHCTLAKCIMRFCVHDNFSFFFLYFLFWLFWNRLVTLT